MRLLGGLLAGRSASLPTAATFDYPHPNRLLQAQIVADPGASTGPFDDSGSSLIGRASLPIRPPIIERARQTAESPYYQSTYPDESQSPLRATLDRFP